MSLLRRLHSVNLMPRLRLPRCITNYGAIRYAVETTPSRIKKDERYICIIKDATVSLIPRLRIGRILSRLRTISSSQKIGPIRDTETPPSPTQKDGPIRDTKTPPSPTQKDGPIRDTPLICVAVEKLDCKTPLRIEKDGRFLRTIKGTIWTVCAVSVFGLVLHMFISDDIDKQVLKKFMKGDSPSGLRSDPYIKRSDVEDRIKTEYCDKVDTDGMLGVVFGAAGTSKSNVLRHICAEYCNKAAVGLKKGKPLKGGAGVLYMELGSDEKFAHEIAKACGIPLEPNILDMVISYAFPMWKKHLTLPSDSETKALATVFPVISKVGKKYHEDYDTVPVLIIDGTDIVAKNNKKLFDALVEWAKRCANDDSLLIVLGSSDGHVLRYLDRQSCKSRSAPFIEVTDFFTLDEELEDLFIRKGVKDKDDQKYLFDNVTGGRLTDNYKATRLHARLVKENPNRPSTEIREEILFAFKNEITQALNKAMDNPSNPLQLEIAAAVVYDETKLSIHDLAIKLVKEGKAKSITEAMGAMQKFIDNNILRYNEKQQLKAHSRMANTVLMELVDANEKKKWFWCNKKKPVATASGDGISKGEVGKKAISAKVTGTETQVSKTDNDGIKGMKLHAPA